MYGPTYKRINSPTHEPFSLRPYMKTLYGPPSWLLCADPLQCAGKTRARLGFGVYPFLIRLHSAHKTAGALAPFGLLKQTHFDARDSRVERHDLPNRVLLQDPRQTLETDSVACIHCAWVEREALHQLIGVHLSVVILRKDLQEVTFKPRPCERPP